MPALRLFFKMALNFDGFVLRPPRSSQANAITTAAATTGVIRNSQPVPSESIIDDSPDLVDAAAIQYRAAILNPAGETEEYLIFAANTSNLTVLEDTIITDQAKGNIVQGTFTVVDTTISPDDREDGSDRVVIVDDGNRSVFEVISFLITRGDTDAEISVTFSSGDYTFNAISGIAVIESSIVSGALQGGLSKQRGDKISDIVYKLASNRFWWTKNDAKETRFAFNGGKQRWEPIKGSTPKNLGPLKDGENTTLSPKPGIPKGLFLPGDSGDPDTYSMVRIGENPGTAGAPVAEPPVGGFGGIMVVDDALVEDFDFSTNPTYSGVVGEIDGIIKWNPNFVAVKAGQEIWYSQRTFQEGGTGLLGKLLDTLKSPMFVAPIPKPTEYPFIKFGSRKPLDSILVDTEAKLLALTVSAGQVGVALSTGRLAFNADDVDRSDPDAVLFDIAYLGAQVVYDGISMVQVAQPTRAPAALVDGGGSPATVGSGDLFVPDSEPLFGLGKSGVIFAPDQSGTIPNDGTDPDVRKNDSGLLREVRSVGDLIFFTPSGVFDQVQISKTVDSFPKFDFQIRKGTIYVALKDGNDTPVKIGTRDKARFGGEQAYILQADVLPCTFYTEARLFSRLSDTYTLKGNEKFKFALNSNEYEWEAVNDPGGILTSQGGVFTAQDIATSLNSLVGAGEEVVVVNGRVTIQVVKSGGNRFGKVEIGYGPNVLLDLSGPSALGFLPGWHVNIIGTGDPNNVSYVPDSGASLGVFRSTLNLDRALPIPDFKHRARLEDTIFSKSVMGIPVVLLDNPPLEDEAGYDDGIFFAIKDGLSIQNLVNFETIYYQFQGDNFAPQPKFSWADTHNFSANIQQPVVSLDLQRQQVIADTMHPNVRGGLAVAADGGAFVDQELGEDYLLDLDGESGQAVLIDNIGSFVVFGGNASFTAGTSTFTDGTPGLDFVALGVAPGYLLKILSGDSQGYYVIDSVTGPNTLEVSPNFPSTSVGVTSWEIYEGVTLDTVDQGIVADQFFTVFNHLPQELFIVKTLDLLGTFPTSIGDQTTNRLQASVSDALTSGREIRIRMALPALSTHINIVFLGAESLGPIANGSRFVPDAFPASDRFTDNAYSIQLGIDKFTFSSGKIILLANINDPVPADSIGVLAAGAAGDGELKFGVDLLVNYTGSQVTYVEEFLDPNLITPKFCELNTQDGFLNFAAADMSDFGGDNTYFDEKMVTEGGLDVTISPVSGGVFFTKPLREGQIVEATYFSATDGGKLNTDPETGLPIKIVEFLPIAVRLETATVAEVQFLVTHDFRFNPDEKTIFQASEPQVFVKGSLIGFLGDNSVVFDFERNIFTIGEAVNSTDLVEITYFVLEAFGGEAGYGVSTPPVFRPPFRIEKGSKNFVLETDRTSALGLGDLLRVGATPFYITSVTYDNDTDETTVGILPTPLQDAGSLAPGNDALSVVSVLPVSTALNPASREGFFETLAVPFEDIPQSSVKVVFLGDVTQNAIAGHILEIGGDPFVIKNTEIDPGGAKTTVNLTSSTPRTYTNADVVKISVRPIYPPVPTTFLGQGPILPTEDFDVILFGELDESGNELPGRILRLDVDYELDVSTGAITFLTPNQGPLLPGQTLYFRRIQVDSLFPQVVNGILIEPRYKAGFAHRTIPSEENGYLEKTLVATYTFSNPDSFYFRTVPLIEYLAEVGEELNQNVAANSPSGGPVVAAAAGAGGQENFDVGNLGLDAQLVDLRNQDRAGRHFLRFYNDVVVSFEQILEAISGAVIGDRDGKFRYSMGIGLDFAPPGFEDPYCGELNNRNVYGQLFFDLSDNLQIDTDDFIVDPDGAIISSGIVDGDIPDSDLLSGLISDQRDLIKNDVDDIVLVGLKKTQRIKIPIKAKVALGRYKKMGEPHVLSRLFPERANAFTITSAGIGADEDNDVPGVYSRRKRLDGDTRRTTGRTIATISNPILDVIEDVSSVSVNDRLARARIFAYSQDGFPEFDTLHGTTTAGNQTVIATPLLLKDFPIDPDTGFPDIAQLQSQGGDLIDLTTGDPDLFLPPFSTEGGAVAFGHPDGVIDAVGADKLTIANLFGLTSAKAIFVEEIQVGCAIIFNDGSNIMTSGDAIIVVGADGKTGDPVELALGDTVFLIPPDSEIAGLSDPPTTEEMEEIAASLPGYRVGFDVELDGKSGELKDKTYLSFRDPFFLGFKELFGQKPPQPLVELDMVATFRNARVEPLDIPALTGGLLNDDGDFTIPYLALTNTEIVRLQAALPLLLEFFVDTPIPSAVFPDEILGNDGFILNLLSGSQPPSILYSAVDPTPVATAGSYTPNSGIGDLRSYDFLFIETNNSTLPLGSQGIQSVGKVEFTGGDARIEPPRFISLSQLGNFMSYTFLNAITYVNQGVGGMVIRRAALITFFDATSASNLFDFNDGTVGVIGGLNDIITMSGARTYPSNDNIVQFNLWRQDTGAFLQTVEIKVNTSGVGPIAIGDAAPGGEPLLTQPLFDRKDFTLNTNLDIVTIALIPNPGELPEDPGNPGQTLPLWFTVSVITAGATVAASETAEIEEDRLTYTESFDLRSVLDRNTPQVGGVDVHGKLFVSGVAGPGGSTLIINNTSVVNGGDPFTFKDRNASFPFIGSFSSGRGSIQVQAFEGYLNTEIINAPGEFVTFSGLASSDQDENGIICQGSGFCESKTVISTPADSYFDFDSRVAFPTVTSGALANIEKGDVVVVKQSTATTATTKAGTYLVRHVIDSGGPDFQSFTTVSRAVGSSSPNGILNLQFPLIVRNDINASLVVEITFTQIDGEDIFDSSERIYFIPDPSDLTTVLSADYTSFDTSNQFFLDVGTFEDADGNPVSTAILGALPVGTIVSGFTELQLRYKNASDIVPPLPSDYLVGYRGDRLFTFAEGGTAFGIRNMEIRNPAGGTEVFPYAQTAAINTVVAGLPSIFGAVTVISSILTLDYGEYSNDEDARYYDNMPDEMRIGGVTPTQWDNIHGNVVGASQVNCLVPGDEIACDIRLQGGIFLEPTIPKSTSDLANTAPGQAPRVVDNSHDLDSTEVGFRSLQDFGGLTNPAPGATLADPEEVDFEVRRIRRFHEVQENFSAQIEGLSFAYEIRRGITTSLTAGAWPYTFTANDATQLGPFDDPDVNINPGDFIRLLDSDGNLVDTAEIAKVESGDTLLLAAPGFSKVTGPIAGDPFEIFIKQAPVPHEQSNQELFEFMTDETILKVQPDYFFQEGGSVDVVNQLKDNTGGSPVNFEAAGVQVGDILVIDPQGPVEGSGGVPTSGQEFGARPFGDTASPNRAEHVARRPSELDDNRGYYFVTGIPDPETLDVSGEGDFGGLLGNDIIFGTIPDTEYVVYPTISAAGDEEGQVDLRPTALSGTNGSDPDSFKDNFLSIAPFGYQIIRPSGLFSREAQELILFMRERMLSWIEELGSLKTGNKKGSYFIFQRDLHIQDLGDPNDPNSGLGLTSNSLVLGLSGLFQVSPFANTTDCLSIMDRRFWILDLQLDIQKPPGSGGGDPTYSTFESNAGNPSAAVGDGRPVLPDRVDDILDNVDQFRALRLSWLDFRTNVQNGTLSAIERFVRELPKRRREQLRLLLQNRSLESV